MAEQRFLSKMTFMTGGFIIWATHFVVVYVFNALACARFFAGVDVLGFGIVPLTLTVLTVLALLATAWVMLKGYGWGGPMRGEAHDDPSSRFVRHMTLTIGALSLVAIFWQGIVTLILIPCT